MNTQKTSQGTNPTLQGFGTNFHRHNGVDAPTLSIKEIKNIFFGNVKSDGSKGFTFPIGWSVSEGITGVYTITHNLGTTNYLVVANSFLVAGFQSFASIQGVNANNFVIETYANGGLNSCQFDFIVIKP